MRWAWVGALALVVAAAGQAGAHEGHDHGSTQRLMGTVVSVDGDRLSLRGRDGGVQVVTVTRATRFAGGRTAADLRPGARVAVEARRSGSQLQAVEVRVGRVAEPPTGRSEPVEREARLRRPREGRPPLADLEDAERDLDAEDVDLDDEEDWRADPRVAGAIDCENAYLQGYRDAQRDGRDRYAREHGDLEWPDEEVGDLDEDSPVLDDERTWSVDRHSHNDGACPPRRSRRPYRD